MITDDNGSKAHLETYKTTADGLVKVAARPRLFRVRIQRDFLDPPLRHMKPYLCN